jgi:hypothetical protein
MLDFKVLDSLLDSWKTNKITTEMFYESVKDIVLKDLTAEREILKEFYSEIKNPVLISVEKTRPLVSGLLLKHLENWVSQNLVVKESALGELTKDLYYDYASYLYNLEIEENISRKSFPQALEYFLKTSKNAKFVNYTPGRNGFFTGVEFNSQKKTVKEFTLERKK